MVNNVTMEWQSKRRQGRIGKAQGFFHSFCGTLKSHSSLLKLLPESNEYVAIFAGSLNAVIKVRKSDRRTYRPTIPDVFRQAQIMKKSLKVWLRD